MRQCVIHNNICRVSVFIAHMGSDGKAGAVGSYY